MGDPQNDSFPVFTRYVVGESSMSDTLDHVCRSALATIEPAAMAGLTMDVHGRELTAISTHSEVLEIEQCQYVTGEGPSLDAVHTGEAVYIRATGAQGAYPEFRSVAQSNGVGSVLSTPMSTRAITVGALNLYAQHEDAFGDVDAGLAREFATQAAYLMMNARAYWDVHSLADNLQQAITSRAEIEQAKGIIMATTGVTADEAFGQLAKQSQHQNVKLRDIAREIVNNVQRRP